MLVIRRRQGESILIGDGIEVEVIDVSSGRVKIGIKAPPSVPILRKEVRMVAGENVAAARAVGRALASLRQQAFGGQPPAASPAGGPPADSISSNRG